MDLRLAARTVRRIVSRSVPRGIVARAPGILIGLVIGWIIVSAPEELSLHGGDDEPTAASPPAEASVPFPAAYTETLPGTAVSIRMVPVPPREGHPGFWMSECEITWDVFDLFIFGIDGARESEGDEVDAYTRPSKPYIPPDRGFGHEGYPVISSSYRSAKQFCRWLSAKTGNGYRLPTVTEWRHAAAAGSTGRWCFGDEAAQLGEHAWYDDNADWQTHPVRGKKPNAWGLYDVHGNAGEWCVEVKDGKRRTVLCGGSFQDLTDNTTTASFARPEDGWQMTDPQVPKSRWWLSDAPFAGLRILRPFPTDGTTAEDPKKSADTTEEKEPDAGDATPAGGTKEDR